MIKYILSFQFDNIFICEMKTTIFIAVLLAVCLSQTFEEFEARFNIRYPNADVRSRHEAVYLANKAQIDSENARNRDYKQAINAFSDLTQEQMKLKLGIRPLIQPDNPNPTRPEMKLRGGLPLQVDWRTQGKVTAVKSQGNCGSCWAFTTTALYESIVMIAGGGTATAPDLSEEYVLECTTQNSPGSTVSSCGGGILQYAIPFIVRTGIPTEASFPYAAAAWTIGATGTPTTAGICTTTALIKETGINGSYVGTYSNLTNTDMKGIIAYAPVTGAMYAGGAFMTYSGGIYTGCPDFNTSVGQLNHAVLIVGYDSSGNYIIKNSWGTSWGASGYATISKTADCGLSYSPREIRGTNAQLKFERMLIVSIVLALIMFFV